MTDPIAFLTRTISTLIIEHNKNAVNIGKASAMEVRMSVEFARLVLDEPGRLPIIVNGINVYYIEAPPYNMNPNYYGTGRADFSVTCLAERDQEQDRCTERGYTLDP